MKLVYNFYSSFEDSKYKVAPKFGKKIISVTKSTDVSFLSVVLTCKNKAFLTLRLFITNYNVNSSIVGRHGLPEAIS